jgi:hypothetical protein
MYAYAATICVACKINNLAKRGQGGANTLFACCIMAGNVYIGAMTTTTATNGRLCNQIIRNLAVSLLAEKRFVCGLCELRYNSFFGYKIVLWCESVWRDEGVDGRQLFRGV